MKPISNKLLGMSATLYTVQARNEDREETWSGAVELKNIYIKATDGEKKGAQGMERADAATLFFDAVNSYQDTETPVEFAKGQRVEYDGGTYFINTIRKHYTGATLHHYEIGLA